MPIPAAKVKAICSSSEAALVRASRGAELESLSTAELKKQAVQARRLFDKWQELAREQARDRRRQSGVSKTETNTQLKEQIFREALDAFEARLAKVDSAATKANPAKPKAKQERAVEHRATRAVVRKKLTAVETKLNTPVPPVKTTAAATAGAPSSAAEAASTSQHAAVTAVKQSRMVQSGKASRMMGHTAARGKRSQARRDSRG